MRLPLATLLKAFGVCAALAQAPSLPAWPPLPATGFVSGRAANDKDIRDGNAVFALQAYGVPFGKPLAVAVPQYATMTRKGQPPVRVIVVQAEEGKHIKFFGVRDMDGKTFAVRDYEIQLLGTKPPD